MNKPMKMLGAALFILQSSLLVSCSDWDDHYDANTSLQASQQSTLWQNIHATEDLSQFASLLQQTGYDKVLDASQTFTVWAPVNGTFDYTSLSATDNDRLTREFIQNHIARNNYPASGVVDLPVYMLNEKLMNFSGSGSFSIQDIPVGRANIASLNGTVHTLEGRIPFMQNIYEALNTDDYALDSISDYFHSFDVKELNIQKSVAGPTLNGEITYLDSVFDEHNDLFQRYSSFIQREDSNYTMIIPTNEAWTKAKRAILDMYHYGSFSFAETVDAAVKNNKVAKITLRDANQLRDSIVNMMLLRDLFYNNNIYDNKHLQQLQAGQTLRCDSLMSTTMSKVYSDDAARLFEQAHRVDKSNGAVWVTDSLRMRTWTSWNPEIVIEGELATTQAAVFNGSLQSVNVSPATQNPDITGRLSNGRYLEVAPGSASSNPEIDFYLPGVRSTTYNIYAVFVPANIENASRTAQPNRMIVTMGFNSEKGDIQEERFRNEADNTNYLVSDPTKIDTLFLGEFTFPIAYYGLGNDKQSYAPYIRFRSGVSSSLINDFDRTLRIDCLILRPKELDDFLKSNPGYKYDNGNY